MGWVVIEKDFISSQSSMTGCTWDRFKVTWECTTNSQTTTEYRSIRTGGDCSNNPNVHESIGNPGSNCPSNGDDDAGSVDADNDDGWLTEFLDDILTAIETGVSAVMDQFASLWESFTSLVSDLKDSLLLMFDGFVDSLFETVEGIIDSVTETITDLVDDAVEMISSTASNVIDTIDRAIDSTFNALVDTFNEVTDFIDSAANQFYEYITSLFDDFLIFMEEIFVSATMFFEEVANSVIEAIDEFIEPIALEIDSLFTEIGENVQGLFDSVSETIDEGIQSTWETIDRAIVEFSEVADQLSDELADITGGVLSEIEEFSSVVRHNIGQPFADLLDRLLNAWFMQDKTTLLNSVLDVFETIGDPYENLARYVNNDISFSDLLFDPNVKTSFFGVVLASLQAMVAKGLLGIQAVNLANTAKVEKMIQDVWEASPVKAFSFPEAISIHVRGFLTDAQARMEASKSGYNDHHFDAAKQAAEKPIDVERSTAAYLRGFINEGSFETYLKREGYNEADREILKHLAFRHPPVQDVITMAVREVFSPDVANRFNLFDDLPEQFLVEAEKGGLSKEWATRYWGAHWRLPSASQGFEMYHRGFITEEELDLLIRALDVSPFWRGPLKSIAYRPVTRVDIRRMLKLGVIDVADTERRYRDLGYSPEDAILMTEFAVSLLPDEELEDEIDFRDLTRTQVKTLYLQGTFSKSVAIDKLEESGYSPDASMLLVGSWEAEQLIKERNDILSMVISKAIRENLTVQEIERTVFSLNLTPEERERIDREILLRSRDYPSIPSKSELLKMYNGQIISGQQWASTMAQHGYNEQWIDRYAKLYGVEYA